VEHFCTTLFTPTLVRYSSRRMRSLDAGHLVAYFIDLAAHIGPERMLGMD